MTAITCQISESSLKSRPKPSKIHKGNCLGEDIVKSGALKMKWEEKSTSLTPFNFDLDAFT